MKTMLVGLIAVAILAGCAGDMQISKCKSYKDGICVNTDVKTVALCNKPLKVNGKTYCEK